MAKSTHHLIFEVVKSQYWNCFQRATIPFIADDPNQGLPDWFFNGNFINFELTDAGTVEWCPAVGPAPYWIRRYIDFSSHEEMLKAWANWFMEVY